MTGYLSGRSALITGGLTGQGLAVAAALAKEGANVAVGSFVRETKGWQEDTAAYPVPDEISEVKRRLEEFGAVVHAGHLDVRDSRTVDDFIDAAQAVCGPVDILVNAAGTCAEQPVCGHTDDLWMKIIDTNLTGAFRTMRSLMPGMIERKWGRIINIGSTAAMVGWKDNPAYCASKSGLLGLTRCAALEGAPHGVTCVMISPTWVETELMQRTLEQIVEREGRGRTVKEAKEHFVQLNPQNRMLQPEEIGALAAFLCSEGARGITMENIQITGGALW